MDILNAHKACLILLSTLLPCAALADDLTCVPDTMCIDAECQAGHDDRATVALRDWTAAKGVLHSDYGDVAVLRQKQAGGVKWSGRNAEGQTETLSVRSSDLHFEYVVQLDATSVTQKLTAKGTCEVTR